ncbi:MAG: menaquinone biosynthesis protein [Candidatus Eremiobacteraeota bacterium]|nr:menaquinone biosynthesis protein [Candidatus Eremiobacteraeota bacterium]
MLACGRIGYTNDLPIYAAFDEGAVRFSGTLHSGVPSALNAMLVEGRLALSPISAFAYAQHASELVLLPDLCIGAKREVLSVLLVSKLSPALLDGATIAVTAESASGVALLRVLLEQKWRVHTRFVTSDDPLKTALRTNSPALLIGERAIDARFAVRPDYVYDLGSVWYDWTGEASVFAVWAARRDVFERDRDSVQTCMRELRAAYAWGAGHRKQVIARAQLMHPRPVGFYEEYYEKLNFELDSAARRGLQRYFEELCVIGAIKENPLRATEDSGVFA